MTRHYAESNINILLTRNLPTDYCVRQWSHLLMIPLHCLWAKSNNRKHGQFECDDTWIWMFWFCWFTCTVHLLFSGFLNRVGDGLGIGGMVHLGKILKLNGQWVGDLENLTTFMDVICVLSLSGNRNATKLKLTNYTFTQQHSSGFIQRRLDYIFISNGLQFKNLYPKQIFSLLFQQFIPLYSSLFQRKKGNIRKTLSVKKDQYFSSTKNFTRLIYFFLELYP